MKILVDHPMPFLLAHGGLQIQIEQTIAGLHQLGVAIEPVRWWDESQTGDIVHYFGRPLQIYVAAVRQKQKKLVVSDLFTGLGTRSGLVRAVQRRVMQIARQVLPGDFTFRLGWESYGLADAVVTLTPWEAQLVVTMFDAPASRVHCVPNGVETEFLDSRPAVRGQWLVCTATITERKRVLELAEAAVRAQTPLWVLGKPYSETDAYAVRFTQLAKAHPTVLRYEGALQNRAALAQVYREARGFVLLSSMESLSLSALEAAACGCPLLLSDQPWARTVFGAQIAYSPIRASTARTAENLRQFYDAAPRLKPPDRPLSWKDIAGQLKAIYESVLSTAR
jgi:glycosyltransferase involved in cell wall biosynthesis